VVEVEGGALHRPKLPPRPEVELVIHPPRRALVDREHVPLLKPGPLVGCVVERDLAVVVGDPVRNGRLADPTR